MAERKIERISQRLSEARKDVEYATTRADIAETEWIKVKRGLQQERECVQLPNSECDETRQSAMRLVEGKKLELANALNAATNAERRMPDEQKYVQRLKLEKDDEAKLAKRRIKEISQYLADTRKDDDYVTARAGVAEDNSWTVNNWFGLSMEELSLLLGSFKGQGTTNVKPWIESSEVVQAPQPNDIKWELIWRLHLPANLISFLREICMNHVPLGDKQTKRNLRGDGNCPFGCSVAEDLDHLFMKCPLSRAVWFGSTLNLRVGNISPTSIQFWVLSVLMRWQQDQRGKVRAFLEWITCVCWCIYQHRNSVIFHHQQPSPIKVLHHLNALLKEVNNIHDKPPQSLCAMTVFKASSDSQEALEQTDEIMVTYLEEELANANCVLCQHEHWKFVHKYEFVEREMGTDHQKDDVGEQLKIDKQTTMPCNDDVRYPLGMNSLFLGSSQEGTTNPKAVIKSRQDNFWTVDCWFGLSIEEFSLLLGSSPEQGTTNVKTWNKSCELLQTPQPYDIKWELIWKMHIPANLISFLRKICMNHVPLGEKRTKRNLRTDGNCSFGCLVTEDLDHLFMKCPLSRAVWFGSTLNLRVENISPASIQFWVLSVLMRSQQDQTGRVRAFLEWITCVCWCIYQHRNAIIFHHQQPSPVKVLHHLSALMKDVNNNIHHKPAQSSCAKTVFKASLNSQVAKEARVIGSSKQDENIQMLECEFSKGKRELEEKQEQIQRLELELEEITKNYMSKVEETRVAQRRKQEIYIQILENAGKARDAERIRQEEIIQILKIECAKLKRKLEEERKLVQRLKLKEDNEAQVTKRKVEEIGQELANARKNVEYVSTRALDAENKWIKAKSELQEEQQLVQLLKLECEETRQSVKRQVEEMELELTNAFIASIAAESRAVAAEENLSDLEKEIKSSGDMACAICLTNEKDMAFGCGHVTCGDCGLIISMCPICREPITSRLRLFLG